MSTHSYTEFSIWCDAIDHASDCPRRTDSQDQMTARGALDTARADGWMSERLGGCRVDQSPQCWREHHLIAAAGVQSQGSQR